MANTHYTRTQFVNARRALISAKFYTDDYAKHLNKVWAESDGFGKKGLVERTQEALVERFGAVEGAKKFAQALEV